MNTASDAPSSYGIVNAGGGAWVFNEHANLLARALWLDITSIPVQHNYLLAWDSLDPPTGESFIPYEAILLVSDKRRLAEVFEEQGVAAPRTILLDSPEEVHQVVRLEANTEWALKWPTGCGAAGHRLVRRGEPVPEEWPRPYVLQKFIRLEVPEVYRLYCVAGETFGWNVRRFPAGAAHSPWVAHAQGAGYEDVGAAPADAESEARKALAATGLLPSFGCADLLRDEKGQWLVLEVNTDGLFNHVDRDISLPGLAEAIDRRLAEAFWAETPSKPWGESPWRLRPV